MHSTSTSHRNPHMPHAVDPTPTGENAWQSSRSRSAISAILRGRRPLVERFRRLAAPTFFFSYRLRADQDRSATLDLLGVILTLLRKLDAKMDMGSTERSFELGAHPARARPYMQILCNVTVGPSPLVSGHFSPVSSIAGKIVDYARREAVGPCSAYANACMSTADQLPTWMAQQARHRPHRDEGERGTNATAGLLCRRVASFGRTK